MSGDSDATPPGSPVGTTPVFGIVGWKKSGKTTLTVRLIETLTARGLRVASVKHAHHAFSVDEGETDSARHRRAGASQVAVVSDRKWAIVTEIDPPSGPDLDAMLARLDPADLVIVEGFKTAPIPKLEARRTESHGHAPLAPTDPFVVAIASDHAVEERHVPVFDIADVPAIADFILDHVGLSRTGER